MSQHRIMRDVIFPACSILLCCCMAATNRAADWPTYRYDTNRSAVTSEQLKLPLSLVWQRESSAELRRAWSEAEGRTVEGRDLYDRLRFDDAFQVAVAGQFVYFGSSVDHQLHCVHAGTGETKWSYFTGAPIRLAPTISEGRVYVGSDDGYAYCLDANRGELIWKYRPGPNEEWFLGRGEMISRWPVRTGILVDAGIAYFGAGIFPHENVYMCAVNAETGKVVWRNDSISHQQAGREDLSPQGYLLASDSHIHVPSGRTLPKSFERESGKLVDASVDRLGISTSTVAGTNAIMFEDRLHAYSPGSQIAGSRNTSYVTTGTHLARLDRNSYSDVKTAASALRNQLRDLYRKHVSGQLADEEYQEQTAELREKLQRLDQADVGWRVPCTANSAVIVAGNHVFVGGQDVVLVFDATNGKELFRAHVAGDARGLAAAAGKLFVSTSKGSIYAFGESGSGESHTAARSVRSTFDEDPSNDAYRTATEEILQQTQIGKGFCLIVDCERGQLAYQLARQSQLKIYAVGYDEQKVEDARRAITATGLYGSRITVHHVEEVGAIPYSNYFANLIVSESSIRSGELPRSPERLARHLKPAGGVICLGQPDELSTGNLSEQQLADWWAATKLTDHSHTNRHDNWMTLTRGTLPGAGNWSHQYGEPGNTASSGDQLVQGGLGVLWYGDPGPEMMVNRHQGAVGPLVVDGRMFIQGEDSLRAYDAYNGLFLWEVANPEAIRTGVFQNRAPGNLAAGNELLFHMVRQHVYAHDVATGEVKAIYGLPDSVDKETHEWGYLAFRDGRLIGTATTRDVIQRYNRRRGNPGSAATDAIFAIDTATGKHLWSYQGKSIDFQTIALGPHRVFFIDSSVTSQQREEILRQDKTKLKSLEGEAARLAEERMKKIDVRLAVAIDAQSGEVRWKNPVDVTDCSDIGTGGGKLTLIYQNDTLLLCGANANGHYWKQFIEGEFERRRLVALSATLGYERWAKDANYRHRPIVIGDRVIAEPWSFDLHTGEQEMRVHPLTGDQVPWSIARPGHHCGMLTASDNMLIFRSGFTGFYDLTTDSGTRHFAGHRLGCWINAIPTNGLVVMPEASAGCVCMFSIASTIVMEPRAPRRPWSLFSQTGPTTPVRHMALNLGAPGDRRDRTGKLWLAWPRPSDKPRNRSTDRTGLGLEFNVKSDFLENGKFFSHDGDATTVDSEDRAWLVSSGAKGLARLTIPLLGEKDQPGLYTVQLHFSSDGDAHPSDTCVVRVQQQQSSPFADSKDVKQNSQAGWSRQFEAVKVAGPLVVELESKHPSPTAAQLPVLSAIEITRSDGL